MRQLITIQLACALALAGFAAGADGLFEDKVLVRGNGIEIKQSELDGAFLEYKTQVVLAGQTMGSAASGATAASDDYEALFTFIWTYVADSEAPVSTGRGASAAADWAANKTITLPDARGRVLLGKDNMGGSSANVVTDTEADTIGDVGGEEDHTQTESELVSHTHSYTAPSSQASQQVNPGTTTSTGSTTGATGGGTAFNILQPYLTINVFIRY